MENIITVVLIVIAYAVAFVCELLRRNTKKRYELEHSKLLGLQEEYSKLAEAYKIKKNNKEKADETINALHNGTLSADDVLPKR